MHFWSIINKQYDRELQWYIHTYIYKYIYIFSFPHISNTFRNNTILLKAFSHYQFLCTKPVPLLKKHYQFLRRLCSHCKNGRSLTQLQLVPCCLLWQAREGSQMVYECCRDNSRLFCDICWRGGWGDNTYVQRSGTHCTLTGCNS